MDKKTILVVGVDFSEGTERLVAVAEGLARDLGAGLVYVHAAEPGGEYVPVAVEVGMNLPVSFEVAREELGVWEVRCEALARGSRQRGLEAEWVVEVGDAAEVLLGQVRVRGAGMMVMGSHGHGALYHLFGGNVVTTVLRRAEVPVVVVPTRRLAEEGERE